MFNKNDMGLHFSFPIHSTTDKRIRTASCLPHAKAKSAPAS